MKDERRKAEQPEVLVGIDVGSTTTKIVVMQTGNSDYKVVFSNYERHHADQLKSVLEILKKFDEKMPAQSVSDWFRGKADCGKFGCSVCTGGSSECDCTSEKV